jgi:pyridoxine/pyridoxamine 5'-phosphate oxidase
MSREQPKQEKSMKDKAAPKDDLEQSKRFLEAAKETEADETETVAVATLRTRSSLMTAIETKPANTCRGMFQTTL